MRDALGLFHFAGPVGHCQPFTQQHLADIAIRRREVRQRAPVAVFPARARSI